MFLKDSILFCGVSGKLPARPQLSTVVCFFLLFVHLFSPPDEKEGRGRLGAR